MFDDLPTWVGEQLTPWGIIIIVVVFIISGRLIPLFYYKELKEEVDRLRASNKNLTTAVGLFAEAMPEVLEFGKTTAKIMDSVQEKLEESA